ncbi:oxidoreductase [Lysobacter bugurensis]|uniref:Oxidoreductase n=2 Tax=Cognatilysobacter bugurensis TaxID=543356 RepID=A0A918W4W9_9GAMM|nr:oxidoreductase [Lysobacter bugurensis]
MIGCGAVTEVKSGPAFQLAEGSALVAVATRRAEAARDYAHRHGVPAAFESIDALIASDDVDAVYIATPPASHLELALKVARAGKPCCVEKPMALNHAQCVEMVEAFEARGLPLFVSYYRRSLPRFSRVKHWLDEGRIGEVRDVRWHLVKPPSPRDLAGEPNWRTDPDASPGGYFSDLASHGLDLLQHLLGDIEAVCGWAVNQQGLYRAEDAVVASWRFASGALGSGSWNFGGSERRDDVEIIGARGSIRFSVFDDVPLHLWVDGVEISESIEHPTNIQLHHVANMIRHLRGDARHPALGVEAAKTSRVMDRILGAC